LLPQFENLRTLRTLAEKVRIKAACHNFRAQAANKARKKILIRSEAWLQPTEFLEFALRDELEKSSSLIRGVNRWRTV
jgi:hypothetical protein